MKKINFLTILLATAFYLPCFAQNTNHTSYKHDKKFNITLNPFGLRQNASNIGLDYAIRKKLTLGGNVYYANLDTDNVDAQAAGFGFKAQLFSRKAFTSSFYTSLFTDFGFGSAEDPNSSDKVDISAVSVGLTGGYMWAWSNFNIQLGAGLGRTFVDFKSNTDRITLTGIERSGLEIDFNFGWKL